MERLKVLLLNLSFALVVTGFVLGPALVVFWFSWRGVLAAGLLMAAVCIGTFTLYLAAFIVRPSDRRMAIQSAIIGSIATLLLAAGAIYLLRNNFPINIGATVLGLAALVWASLHFDTFKGIWTDMWSAQNIWAEILKSPPKRSREEK